MEVNGHRVSTELNLIVGNRGTGKTYFLNKVKKKYPADDIYHTVQFETSKSEEYIERHRRDQGLKAFDEWKSKYLSQFEAILNYLNSSNEDYLESLKIYSKDTSKSNSPSKYQLTKEASFDALPTTSLQKYLESLQKLISSSGFWSYTTETDKNKKIFVETYSELRDAYNYD
jgi:ABC-type Na+ efflux pump permease subunit